MVLDVIEYSFGLMRKKPKVILPQVLGWIPAAFFGVIFYFAFLEVMKVGLSNLTISFAISLLIKYAAPLTAAVIFAYFVTTYLQVVYPDIIRQAFSGKSIELSKAFRTAKSRFWGMLWTDFLVTLFWAAGMLGVAGIAALFPALPGVLLILIIVVIVVLLYIIPGFFMLTTAVALENLSGLNAIKRSFSLANGRKLSIWGVIFLISVFSFAIGMLQAAPVVGVVLALPLNAVVATWAMNASTTYYFMRIKNAKPKL